MLVVRPLPVIENGVSPLQITGGIQPVIDGLPLDRNDAAVMTGRSDLGRRLVSDGGERQQLLAIGSDPPGPEASDQHLVTALRAEFEDDFLVFLVQTEFPLLEPMPADVLEERGYQDQPMAEPELSFPESFQIVSAGVVWGLSDR